MSFKDQSVWVRVDESEQLVLDSDGRAEMKYRPDDDRSYRPSPRNLVPVPGGGGTEEQPRTVEPSGRASGAHSADRPPKPARPKPHVPAKPTLEKATGEVIHVWTDGACSGNPGPMGIGVVVVVGEKRRELGEYLGKGTNNIAELTAIGRGLELAGEVVPGTQHTIRVYTDSSYAIGLLSQGWKAKANQALVEELRALVARYPRLRMVKVEGHAGVPENERCDVLARQAVARHRMD